MSSDYVQSVRCRACGRETEAIKETGDDGNPVIVAPPFCPYCGQPLLFDVLGPIQEPEEAIQQPDTSADDTPPFGLSVWDAPDAVPVVKATKSAYGEAFDNGLDLRDVTPTGVQGVILIDDVITALIKRHSGEVLG